MMIREEHPVGLFHTDLIQVLQHLAIAQVDEQGAVVVLQHIHIAGVLPQIHARSRFFEFGECEARKNEKCCKAVDHGTINEVEKPFAHFCLSSLSTASVIALTPKVIEGTGSGR